eukprot:m51a1_g4518 hypothetical protein (126) ;mRNA; f:426473-426850
MTEAARVKVPVLLLALLALLAVLATGAAEPGPSRRACVRSSGGVVACATASSPISAELYEGGNSGAGVVPQGEAEAGGVEPMGGGGGMSGAVGDLAVWTIVLIGALGGCLPCLVVAYLCLRVTGR